MFEIPRARVPGPPYDHLALEYYDAHRHPLAHALGELSQKLFEEVVDLRRIRGRAVADLGCGASRLAAALDRVSPSLQDLTLIDSSPRMLEHSRRFEQRGARLFVASAEETPIPDASQALITAFLGDPFNTQGFWRECYRVLEPGGEIFFAVPSVVWGKWWRSGRGSGRAESPVDMALFKISSGHRIHVPSLLLERSSQRALIEGANLQVDSVHQLSARALPPTEFSRLAKIMTVEELQLPLLEGWVASRPKASTLLRSDGIT